MELNREVLKTEMQRVNKHFNLKIFILFILCVCLTCLYVYALWVCLAHVDIKGRHWNPCYLSYRWLWATPWVLVNKPRASAGATHIFNSWPIFPASPSATINILKSVQHHLPSEECKLKLLWDFTSPHSEGLSSRTKTAANPGESVIP